MKTTKKARNVFMIGMFGTLLAAVMTGCGTFKVISADETVPEEETAVLYCYSYDYAAMDGVKLKLKSLDGGALPKGFRNGQPIRLPAGEHTLTADGAWYSGLTIVRTGRNGGSYRQYFKQSAVQFTYNFKPGVSYYFDTVLGGGEGAEVDSALFAGAVRSGGEPFIGLIAVYAVDDYDKYALPVIAENDLLEVIGFDQEVSF